MSKRRRWILLPLAALAACLVVVLVLFDWNWLKGPLEKALAASLERRVEVANLDVDLSAAPTITLDRVRVANAEWGSRPDMVTIRQVRFAIALWPLLKGSIQLPFVRVEEPDLLLETNGEGAANWKLGDPTETEGPPTVPIIGDLEITDAAIRHRDPDRPQDLVATLDAVEGAIAPTGLGLSVDGTLDAEPLTLRLASAPLDQLETDATRFPFELHVQLGTTRLAVTGSAERLLEAQGLSAEIALVSKDPEQLLALVGRGQNDLGELNLTASLTSQDQIWTVQQLDLQLGETDLQGRATVRLGSSEPLIKAELVSHMIRLQDLQAFVPAGDGAGGSEAEAAIDAAIAEAKAALPGDERRADGNRDFGLPVDMLPKVDAEVRYSVERVLGPELALADLDLHARLADGLPRLELTGGGRYRDTPVTLDLRLGSGEHAGDAAYPVQARIEAAGTQVRIEGVIGQPETLDGLNLEVEASSEDINRVLALANLDLPQIPPFAVSGHVIRDGQVWRIPDFYGRLGESELTAQLTVDLSEQRPFVRADLQSDRLLVSDLIAAGDKAAVQVDLALAPDEIAEDEADAAARVTEDQEGGGADAQHREEVALISPEGLNFEALPEIDADISFQGQLVEYGEFGFDQLRFDLELRDDIAVLDAAGEGKYRDGPLVFEAHAGTKENLEHAKQPYPIYLRLTSEDTRLAVDGSVARPGQLGALDVDVALAGPDLDRLGEVLQLALPTTPPFDLQSHLTREEDRWHFAGLNGTIGDSDIKGGATIVLGGERPLLEAELISNRLDFDDLGLLVGAPADPEETVSVEQQRAAAEEAATPGVLPDEPFDVPELRAMDARVSYGAKQVQAPNLPLQGVELALTLEDGQLTLEPLRFDLADGVLDAVIRLDGRTDTLSGEIDLGVRNIRLNRLLAHFDIELAEIEVEKEGVGTLGGRAHLTVEGNSVKALAGSADGNAAIIMNGGRISSIVIEGLGLDVGEVLALFAAEGEAAESDMVPVRCFVGRFDLQDGVMKTEALVLETSDSTITGKGQIDLGAETLALELLAHPKDASVLSAGTPVRIEGTFEDPKIDPVSEELKEKSLAALALGVVMPVIGALFPFLEEGETEGTNCARLIADASAAPAPVSDQAE